MDTSLCESTDSTLSLKEPKKEPEGSSRVTCVSVPFSQTPTVAFEYPSTMTPANQNGTSKAFLKPLNSANKSMQK